MKLTNEKLYAYMCDYCGVFSLAASLEKPDGVPINPNTNAYWVGFTFAGNFENPTSGKMTVLTGEHMQFCSEDCMNKFKRKFDEIFWDSMYAENGVAQ